jgi:hypothetical protein
MKSQKGSGSFPFFGVLFLIFLTLKLCSVITWSWWWVTAPLWGGLALVLGIGVIGAIILGIVSLATKSWK